MTINPNDHTEAYNDGYEMAINCNPKVNPYALKKNRESWERGWNAGIAYLQKLIVKKMERQHQTDEATK